MRRCNLLGDGVAIIHYHIYYEYRDGVGLSPKEGGSGAGSAPSKSATGHSFVVGAMSTSQRAVTPCAWGVKAGMVRVWVAGKTV